MPHYWVQQVQDALNDAGKAVKGSSILVLGVAYKKDISDIRESPALDIIGLLEEKGAHLSYHDPHVPAFHHEGLEMTGVVDLPAALAASDCVVVVTDHSAYDWADVAARARLIVDTRRALRGARSMPRRSAPTRRGWRSAATAPAEISRPLWPGSRRATAFPPSRSFSSIPPPTR